MSKRRYSKGKRGISKLSRSRARSSRVHSKSAPGGGTYYVVKSSSKGTFVGKSSGRKSAGENPWPRYPLFDGGDPTFSERAEEELAGFGER